MSDRNEVGGEWRRLYNEELHDSYCSEDKVGGECSMYREKEKCIGKPEGNRPLEDLDVDGDSIKMDLK